MVRRRKPTQAEILASVRIHEADARTRIVQATVPWVGWSLIALFCWLSIHDLAGQITIANIKLFGKAVFEGGGEGLCPAWYVVAVFTVFGIAGMTLAWKNRSQRKDSVEHLHQYQEKWESEQDHSRTSSKLTARGDTRPEDK